MNLKRISKRELKFYFAVVAATTALIILTVIGAGLAVPEPFRVPTFLALILGLCLGGVFVKVAWWTSGKNTPEKKQ